MSYHVRFDDGKWLDDFTRVSDKPPKSGYVDIGAAIKNVDHYKFLLQVYNLDSKYISMGYSIIHESSVSGFK